MFYNLHTHKYSNDSNILDLVNQYPLEVDASLPSFSVGIHPWYINPDNLPLELQIIENTLANKNCLAVGECGLDKRIETDWKLQKKVFIEQIKLAEKHNKPLILHCVAAYQEVIEIKKTLKVSVPMVIHGFSKNLQVANSLLNNGFYLSFGKYLLKDAELLKVLNKVPKDAIFLETDTISESITEIYKIAQSVVDYDINEVVENNFKRIFNL